MHQILKFVIDKYVYHQISIELVLNWLPETKGCMGVPWIHVWWRIVRPFNLSTIRGNSRNLRPILATAIPETVCCACPDDVAWFSGLERMHLELSSVEKPSLWIPMACFPAKARLWLGIANSGHRDCRKNKHGLIHPQSSVQNTDLYIHGNLVRAETLRSVSFFVRRYFLWRLCWWRRATGLRKQQADGPFLWFFHQPCKTDHIPGLLLPQHWPGLCRLIFARLAAYCMIPEQQMTKEKQIMGSREPKGREPAYLTFGDAAQDLAFLTLSSLSCYSLECLDSMDGQRDTSS